MRPLDKTFTPSSSDVILGRGTVPFLHPGNLRLELIIKQRFLVRYATAETRVLKSQIIAEIVSSVRRNSPTGIGFVKCMEDGVWYEVEEHLAREKVSQTLRDALHFKYRSASKSKKKNKGARKRREDKKKRSHSSSSTPPGSFCTTTSTTPPEVSSELSRNTLELPTPLTTTGIGPAAASGMALTELYLQNGRRRQGAALLHRTVPTPPPLYDLLYDSEQSTQNTALSAAPSAHRQQPSSQPRGDGLLLAQRRRTSTAEEEQGNTVRPEDFMAACDELPDSALLKSDARVINAYCTVLAAMKGRGADPKDVLLTEVLLRRGLFKDQNRGG